MFYFRSSVTEHLQHPLPPPPHPIQRRTYFPPLEWRDVETAFSSQREQSEAWQNVSTVGRDGSRVGGRPGLALTSSSSWGSHYVGDWVPSSGLASTQDTVVSPANWTTRSLNTQNKAHKTGAEAARREITGSPRGRGGCNSPRSRCLCQE